MLAQGGKVAKKSFAIALLVGIAPESHNWSIDNGTYFKPELTDIFWLSCLTILASFGRYWNFFAAFNAFLHERL